MSWLFIGLIRPIGLIGLIRLIGLIGLIGPIGRTAAANSSFFIHHSSFPHPVAHLIIVAAYGVKIPVVP